MNTEEITRVGIVGAGTMGTVIALACASHGKEAFLFDAFPAALERAPGRLRQLLDEAIAEGTITAGEAEATLTHVHLCYSLAECLAGAQLVIEVVPERLELKRQVWAEIGRLSPSDALFATSSSSLPCSRLADVTGRPEKMMNLHFPQAWCWPGAPLEVMGNAQTLPEVIAAGAEFVRSLEFMPVMVKKEIMGFGLNTLWHEIKRAALHIADGYLDFEDIDRYWTLGYGAPGLFARMDHVGLDVVRDIELQYYRESGDERNKPPEYLDRLIAQGRLGVKSGRGFYTWPNPEYERPGWLKKEPPWTPDMAIRLDDNGES